MYFKNIEMENKGVFKEGGLVNLIWVEFNMNKIFCGLISFLLVEIILILISVDKM